jgi:type II secretory ATPase GspE/PulE/Tfp pilus assembly ATPase PilB-like protein
MKVEFFLLSSTLKTVVAQRLARRLCENCKQPLELSAEELKEVSEDLKLIPEAILKAEVPDFTTMDDFLQKMVFYKAVGCSHCENTGYLSRTSVSEAIEINDELKKIINDGSHGLTLEVIKKSQDFISIKQDGYLKAARGITTIEEILRVIES